MSRDVVLFVMLLALAATHGVALAQQAPRAAPAAPRADAPAADADAAFGAWDRDGNGSLSRDEFRAGWQQMRRATQVQGRLRQQFATVDANRNGAIDPTEYTSLLLIRNAGKSAPPLSSFDADQDGKLQFGEYLALVQALGGRDGGAARRR